MIIGCGSKESAEKRLSIGSSKLLLLSQLGEQAIASSGAFLFMLVGARLLNLSEFGVVGLMWTLLQFPAVFFYSLVLLPISSSTDRVISRSLVISHSVSLYIAIMSAFFAMAPFLLLFFNQDTLGSRGTTVALLLAWGATHLAFELTRWLIIRYDNHRILAIGTLVRWLFFFSLVFAVSETSNVLSANTYVTLNVVSILFWFCIILTSRHRTIAKSVTGIKVSTDQLKNALPILANGGANVTLSYVTAAAIVQNFSLETFGAFQAFRSITNFFGVIAQFIDNHLTAHWAREGFHHKVLFSYLVVVGLTLPFCFGSAYLLTDLILIYVLDVRYSPYSFMFAYLATGSAAQLFVRPIVASVRLSRRTFLFYWNSALISFGVLPLVVTAAKLQYLHVVVCLFAIAPLTFLFIFMFYKYVLRPIK